MRPRKPSAGALIVPILMAGFGLVYAYANRGVPAADMRLVTPVTIALIFVAFVLVARVVWLGTELREPYTRVKLTRPVALLVCSLILLEGAAYDFPIAAAVFLAASMVALGVRSFIILVAVSILTPIILFLGFTWIDVPLNSFWLGF